MKRFAKKMVKEIRDRDNKISEKDNKISEKDTQIGALKTEKVSQNFHSFRQTIERENVSIHIHRIDSEISYSQVFLSDSFIFSYFVKL